MKIICWWSGGITSAVACKKAIDLYGAECCECIMIDTHNEDPDTYRFKDDCEKWYGIKISTISAIGEKYGSIQEVWDRYSSLNVAHGAICSTELKREVRKRWQKTAVYDYQVFGFEMTKKEASRALAMTLNYPDARPIYPLLMFGLDKRDCISYVESAGIKIPDAYTLGFKNNNCLETGCVQGGIGYWQKMKRERIDTFLAMSDRERRYSKIKGKAVTILKDQSKAAKASGDVRVFLEKNEDFPECKSLDDFPPQKIEGLTECNGYCGTNDLINS